MQDINGKSLNVGDNLYTSGLGFCEIREIDARNISIRCVNHKTNREALISGLTPTFVKVRTWRELAKLALDSSNACNLSGVVLSFAEVIKEVRIRLESEGKGGTDNVNRHPVCVIFAQAIGNMTNCEVTTEFSQALDWADKARKE